MYHATRSDLCGSRESLVPFRPCAMTPASGFTLTELILVVAVIAVLSTIMSVSLSRYTGSRALLGMSGVIGSVLEDARSRTLSSQGGSQYGVHLVSGNVTLFRGDTYSSGDAANEVTPLDARIIVTPTLSGGGTDVVFERLTGQTDMYGTIRLTLSGTASFSKTITIQKTGLLSYE
jgi:prepilin-type N-terminal cleavage/methylation domain-containing protein